MLTLARVPPAYAVASNTFIQRVAPDPINGNLVEIGDSKQPDFYPQLKLMRWQNEVNFSARLVELDASPAVVETVGEVIKYEKASYEAHYYDLGFDDDTGGFEHEIVLKARPAQSIISWTIQTKGLDFLYQAELTPEEIASGVQRPQDRIGSYAVYHSTAANDYSAMGGKNYRSGKAFHIKRPKAHDALGNEVWCELNIDSAAGIMTVTIPQGFLDTAVYPVVVDPTFGYETAGASAVPEPYLFANIFAASRYTASTGDVITKITASGVSASGTDGFGFGIYTFNGTNPVALTGTEQHIVFPTSQAWVDSSALSIGLTNAVEYCVAFGNQDAGTQYVYYDTGVSGDGDVDPTGTALPATFTHDSYTAYKFSMYATYTPGGIVTTLTVSDGIYFQDPDTRQFDTSRLDGVYFDEAQIFDRMLFALDNVLLDHSRYEERLLSALDNVLLDHSRYEERLLTIVDNLFLLDNKTSVAEKLLIDLLFVYDTVVAEPTAGVNVTAQTVVDNMLLLDNYIKNNDSIVSESLIFSDTSVREALKLLVDNFLLSDILTRELGLTIVELMLLDSLRSSVIDTLLRDAPLVGDSVAALRYAAGAVILQYAKLRVTDHLGISLGTPDYLGRTLGAEDFLGIIAQTDIWSVR